MVNKISPLLTFQISRLRPYLTPRTGVISAIALGALGLLIYFLRSKPSMPPITPQPPAPKDQPASQTPPAPEVAPSPKPAVAEPSTQEIAPASPPAAPIIPEPLPLPAAPSPQPAVSRPAPQPPVMQDSNFIVNVQAIIDFPEDKVAQIKSFNGKLGRADGYLQPVNRYTGTQLPETIPIIDNTFKSASGMFEQARGIVADKVTPEEKIRHLRPLRDALTQEMNLLEGLGHIHKVYHERYQTTPDKEGLSALNNLYLTSKASIEIHSQHYQELVQSLQAGFQASQSEGAPALSASIVDPQLTAQLTPEKAATSLSAYCQLYCPGIPSHKAIEMIQQGQLLMREILRGTRQPASKLEDSQIELAHIVWFLKYCALKKEQGAREWSLAIEENTKLYHFLFKSPKSYSRASSHYIGRSPANTDYTTYVMKSSMHHGVDVHNGLMPAQKRTILFELVDTLNSGKVLFFKPENYGTVTPWDLFLHANELRESLQKKSRAQGEDDLPGNQKERVPDVSKKAFEDLLKYIAGNQAHYEPILKGSSIEKAMSQAKLWGIAFMHAFMRGIEGLANVPREINEITERLKATMKSPLDHLDKRTGREIYLTAKDLEHYVSEPIRG